MFKNYGVASPNGIDSNNVYEDAYAHRGGILDNIAIQFDMFESKRSDKEF